MHSNTDFAVEGERERVIDFDGREMLQLNEMKSINAASDDCTVFTTNWKEFHETIFHDMHATLTADCNNE